MLGCAFYAKVGDDMRENLASITFTFPNNNTELLFSWPYTWLMLCFVTHSLVLWPVRTYNANSTVIDGRQQLDLAAEAAKAKPQNDGAQLGRNFFERKPQNIRAKSLKLQNFPVYIFQLSKIFVFVLGPIHHFLLIGCITPSESCLFRA